MRKAVIAGATGLVGGELLNILLQLSDYQEVLILVRRAMDISHPKLVQLIIDFDKLTEHTDAINGHAIFCCLGTTQSQTPAKVQYRKIDHDYPVKLGEIAKHNHVNQYHFISSLGADINSKVFYTRLKGETENDLAHLTLPCLHIYQPSLLIGNRKKARPMEKFMNFMMKLANPLLQGSLKKYQSIKAHTVAMAMYKQSLNNDTGLFIHPSDHIKNIA
ncbi:NAD(P)H-binding protein [Mucilaginibacter sp. KACC 22063]|uniref:NAD(P)H-binding protein n=1 Tax=Mucilaginibacter sp. KACC 22063 TaxID=3025666 RepID=UPI0023672CCF|nr:NAD(P)H-binding protein [Mucilaginibacter sp. KACC 22063]WDF55434.1 NAD(P)H-binding protein [Mucilaginibacter sp. KACC 22063]